MKYLAIYYKKNPLIKILCVRCGKDIQRGACVCGDNKMRTPSMYFCEDCLKYDLKGEISKKFNDPNPDIKYLM